MANAPIQAGIMGSGGMAAARAERIARHPDLTLAAVAGRNAATRDALAECYEVPAFEDWRCLGSMAEVDAVFIATHPDTHAEMALLALEHGKHVFTESPLAIIGADAEAVVEAARSTGLEVRVGHTSLLRPASRTVARQVDRLGGPLLDDVRIQYVNDERQGRVAGFDVRVSGHPLLYAVTLALPAFHGRRPIASIRASASGLGDGPTYESCVATAEIAFESGAVTTIAYLRGFRWPGPGWRTVACREGSVRLMDGGEDIEVVTAKGIEQVAIPEADPWGEEIDEFVAAIRNGAPMAVTLDDARRVVAIAEAAQASAREGRAIEGDVSTG